MPRGRKPRAKAEGMKQDEPVMVEDFPEPEPVRMTIPKPKRWVVAEGKSITCKKGVLSAGDVVLEAYLSGGFDAFETLRKSRIIVEE